MWQGRVSRRLVILHLDIAALWRRRTGLDACLDKVGDEALHSGIDRVYASKAISNVYVCDGKVDVHACH